MSICARRVGKRRDGGPCVLAGETRYRNWCLVETIAPRFAHDCAGARARTSLAGLESLLMGYISESRFRVRYAETDQMGVVYYANYLIWMEIGRVELCRRLGVRYRDMEEQDGVLLTVAEVSCRYHFPARYDEEVAVHTSITQATSRLV